jgi:basic amino acid/polyamine antiporter, APA family
VAIAALVAAATTINTLLTSYSRTIMRASRDRVLPETFAAVHGRFDTPHRAVLFLGVPPLLVAPFTGTIEAVVLVDDVLDWLVTLTVTGIFITFMIGGVALWNLPSAFPQRYEYSIYKLPLPVLKVVAVGNVVVSFAFTLLVAASAPTALAFIIGCMAFASLAYVLRIRAYERRGVDLREEMSLLHKHERIGGESNPDD